MRRASRLALAAASAALLACPMRSRLHPMAIEYNNQCAALINAGRLDEADIACAHAREFNPDYPEAMANQGLIQMSRGNLDKAKGLLIESIRLNNELAQAYTTLGVVERRLRHPDAARERFERALQVNPDYLEARYDLALTFLELGDHERARKEYKTLLLVNPNLADPHHDLGVMALEEHKVPEAIAELEAAATLDPRRPMTWLGLGAAYAEAARYQDAQNAFTSCLNVDPENLPCRRAVALITRAAAAQAPVLQQAVEAEGAYARGLRQREKGAPESAERSFRECAAADPACRFALHQLLEEEGRAGEASAECAAFLRAAPADLFPAETTHCEQEVSKSPSMAPARPPR